MSCTKLYRKILAGAVGDRYKDVRSEVLLIRFVYTSSNPGNATWASAVDTQQVQAPPQKLACVF